MDDNVEKEICNNCKKEIPQLNYVMHTMHCARNITLCKICNEPIPKLDYEIHRERCKPKKPKQPSPPPIALERSTYFQQRKAVEDQKAAIRRENYLRKHEHLVDKGFTLNESVNSSSNGPFSAGVTTPLGRSLSASSSYSRILGGNTSNVTSPFTNTNYRNGPSINTSNSNLQPSDTTNTVTSGITSGATNGTIKKPPLIPRLNDGDGGSSRGSKGMLACRYCDLELPKLELEEHENYCGSRTDKCLECGEIVMFKNKQVHMDSNHGFVKLNDEPGPRPSWDSTTHRSASATNVDASPTRRRFERFRLADVDYDPTPYLPAAYQPGGGLKKNKEGESYKEISRRLDCPAPQPPRRRRNPPTELTIPCEFCDTPIPHEDLIEHETGCRPDLARYNPRRARSTIPVVDEDDYFEAPRMREPPRMRTPPRSDSPDSEELPCEFCDQQVPASQLWRHQMTCTSSA